MRTQIRLYKITAVICLMVAIFSRCLDYAPVSKDPRGADYAGAEKCHACHNSISQTYFHSAHQLSTSRATMETISGSFSKDSNEYFYKPNVKVAMESREDGLYQAAYKNDTLIQAHRFDIAVGSGRKAQTYLYWSDDKIYQLPVSYFIPAKSWANSPNFPSHQVRFDRNIPGGCFECHGSFIRQTSVDQAGKFYEERFDKSSLIYGIDCERCHGPAAKHAAFHEDNPKEKTARYMISFKSLSRQQRLDQCATCHSGIRNSKRSLFYFQPGSSLADFVHPDTIITAVDSLDVHGNQYQLLAASACFIKSELDCSSCHNTHTTERDDLKLFSQRCMNCHTPGSDQFCKLPPPANMKLIDNCIDCHMPAKPSKLITLLSMGQEKATPNFVRTHWIKVYSEKRK